MARRRGVPEGVGPAHADFTLVSQVLSEGGSLHVSSSIGAPQGHDAISASTSFDAETTAYDGVIERMATGDPATFLKVVLPNLLLANSSLLALLDIALRPCRVDWSLMLGLGFEVPLLLFICSWSQKSSMEGEEDERNDKLTPVHAWKIGRHCFGEGSLDPIDLV